MPNIYFEKMHPQICDAVNQPTPATKVRPLWWVDSNYYNQEFASPIYGDRHRMNSTIKGCPAIADSLSMGYILFSPLDIEIDATDETSLHWRVPNFLHETASIFNEGSTAERDFASAHSPDQLEKLKIPEEYHRVPFKINTYFGIKTEPQYSIWVTHPMYNWDLPFRVLDGIIDSDKITARFPYPMLIKKGFSGIIPRNTPLIQVIPFKRESFESQTIDFDKDDAISKISDLQSDQIMPYRKLFWERKNFK
jgi:hypothetical protein